MSHTLRWSSLAAVCMLTAVAMLSGNVRPAVADSYVQGGQGSNGSSCQQSSRYSQTYGDQYNSRSCGDRNGLWGYGRRDERTSFDNGYGGSWRRQSSGYGAWRYQGRGWQSQRGRDHRWYGRDNGQGGQYWQRGQNNPNDRDDDRGYGNDQGQRGR